MRHFTYDGGVLTGQLAAQVLDTLIEEVLADNYPPATPFDAPTLHELYDLEVVGPNDPNEQAVSEFFPESMLLASQEGVELQTPPPITVSPDPPPLSRQPERCVGPATMPQLLPEVIDLTCNESGFPPSEDEDEEGEQFVLDSVEQPGRGCRSCQYHRRNTGDPQIMCSLCYMKMTCMFIYSKFVIGGQVGYSVGGWSLWCFFFFNIC